MTVARKLAEATADPNEPASLEFRHSAINRAYYAAFTAARRLLVEHEGYVLPKTEPSHAQVRDKFRGSDPLRQSLYRLLFNLANLRCRADYKDESPLSQRDMQDAFVWADQALEKVRHITMRKATT